MQVNLRVSFLCLHVVAFVHQNEMLFGYMTVREHLTFQATAGTSKQYNKQEIRERVNQVRHYWKEPSAPSW